MSHIHLPDGVLPPWLWVSGYVASAVLVWGLWGRTASVGNARRFALLGIFAAFMIVVMSIEIPPIPYHANLSVVTAIVLGPALAVVVGFIANFFLAFAGHGGITVVGLNTLVIAVEMLAGSGLFRLGMRARLPLSAAAFLAVVIGLALGTATSYGILLAGAPTITRTLQTAQTAHPGHAGGGEHAGSRDEHHVLEQAAEGARLNTRRLAELMFGLGALGWVLEGALSAAILVALNRLYPEFLIGVGRGDGPL